MAKWCGKVGYATMVEVGTSGKWKEEFTEQKYFGEVIQDSRRLQSANQVNDDVVTLTRISFVADPYALSNFHSIRYAEFMGTKWKVPSVDVQYPRLILTLGGVYNGA
ncbi:hypothetical protein [Fibrobacter sp.]|uniref:DUF7253 family protein n=1 Tax=Fibrobacter sp. TaxID=35828 RepID=UPI00388CF29D